MLVKKIVFQTKNCTHMRTKEETLPGKPRISGQKLEVRHKTHIKQKTLQICSLFCQNTK